MATATVQPKAEGDAAAAPMMAGDDAQSTFSDDTHDSTRSKPHKLVVTQQPPEQWYNQARGRQDTITIKARLVGAADHPALYHMDRLPLSLTLLYVITLSRRHLAVSCRWFNGWCCGRKCVCVRCSGVNVRCPGRVCRRYENYTEVAQQNILQAMATPELDCTTREVSVVVRINQVSRSHQKQRFRVRLALAGTRANAAVSSFTWCSRAHVVVVLAVTTRVAHWLPTHHCNLRHNHARARAVEAFNAQPQPRTRCEPSQRQEPQQHIRSRACPCDAAAGALCVCVLGVRALACCGLPSVPRVIAHVCATDPLQKRRPGTVNLEDFAKAPTVVDFNRMDANELRNWARRASTVMQALEWWAVGCVARGHTSVVCDLCSDAWHAGSQIRDGGQPARGHHHRPNSPHPAMPCVWCSPLRG